MGIFKHFLCMRKKHCKQANNTKTSQKHKEN